MRSLVEQLNQASLAYYNGGGELMTDYEWDAMFDQLKKLEEETGEILPDSPTNKVSEDQIIGQKEEHEFAALSLAKTKQVSDLVKWAENRPIWISWKLDGLTLVVTYDNGILSKVVTRGNGHTGTNITHLLQPSMAFLLLSRRKDILWYVARQSSPTQTSSSSSLRVRVTMPILETWLQAHSH